MSLVILGLAGGHDAIGLVRLLIEPTGEWGLRWGVLGASSAREDFRPLAEEVCDLVALWQRDTPIGVVAFEQWNSHGLAAGVARRVAANLVREIDGCGNRAPRQIVRRYVDSGALPGPEVWALLADPLLQPALICAIRCAEQLVWAPAGAP